MALGAAVRAGARDPTGADGAAAIAAGAAGAAAPKVL